MIPHIHPRPPRQHQIPFPTLLSSQSSSNPLCPPIQYTQRQIPIRPHQLYCSCLRRNFPKLFKTFPCSAFFGYADRRGGEGEGRGDKFKVVGIFFCVLEEEVDFFVGPGGWFLVGEVEGWHRGTDDDGGWPSTTWLGI